ncbi:hypothetical protein GCM10028864_43100 [Microlunatus parietis]
MNGYRAARKYNSTSGTASGRLATVSEMKQHGQAILLTGPPLAGKTSTAMKWAEQRPRTTAPLDWDELRSVLFRGQRVQSLTDVSLQYRFAAKIASATAAHITASGIDCVIAGPRVPASPTDPPEWVSVWDDLDQLDPITIVLLPSLEARLERRRMDTNRLHGRDAITEEQVRESHRWAWQAWAENPRATVLDTTDMTREDVLSAVERAVLDISTRSRVSQSGQ